MAPRQAAFAAVSPPCEYGDVSDAPRPRPPSLATALSPARRAGLLESVKRKIVGRLLLDGGTVEEPARGTRGLDLPSPDRRPPSRRRR